VLLSSASVEILFKSGDSGLGSLWRINQCLYKGEKDWWGWAGTEEKKRWNNPNTTTIIPIKDLTSTASS